MKNIKCIINLLHQPYKLKWQKMQLASKLQPPDKLVFKLFFMIDDVSSTK